MKALSKSLVEPTAQVTVSHNGQEAGGLRGGAHTITACKSSSEAAFGPKVDRYAVRYSELFCRSPPAQRIMCSVMMQLVESLLLLQLGRSALFHDEFAFG